MKPSISKPGATPVRYAIRPLRPAAHLFEVRCTVADPDPAGQRYTLPAWTPGSYMIREYARHVVEIRATTRNGAEVGLRKLDKHTWQADPCEGPLTVTMQVYAWDLSVRGAHLDGTHGFFNGACMFLSPAGCESRRCELEILPPAGAAYRNWRVATSMPRLGAKPWGFGTYVAADHDELIDHPVEMGTFATVSFRAAGVLHDVAITGRQRADLARLAKDLKRVCEAQIGFWHAGSGKGSDKPPFDRYLFLVMVVGEGYGGLEHRASTALLCSRNDLPALDMVEASEAYRGFLGLASHEYFHTWNVKRLKPAAYTPYDLTREAYSTQLWAFEGITSYYDDLALVRCGLLSRSQYLESLGRTLTAIARTPGRKRQTVAESSFDAWIKYYRQDENSPNSQVSYYLKGSMVALALDLHIRAKTGGRKSLDDVMRALWREYGAKGIGLPEGGFERVAQRVTGLPLGRPFLQWLHGKGELPLGELLATHGITLNWRVAESPGDRGGKAGSSAGKPGTPSTKARVTVGVRGKPAAGEIQLTHVIDGGSAQDAGLSAGDVIVAVDGLRVGTGGLEAAFKGRRAGETVTVHAFRRDELMTFQVRLNPARADTAWLAVDTVGKRATPASRLPQSRLLTRWLGA